MVLLNANRNSYIETLNVTFNLNLVQARVFNIFNKGAQLGQSYI